QQHPALGVEQIEEEWRERQLGAHARDLELPAEPAHGHLKRQRPAIRPESDRLTVEDGVREWQASRRFDDLGHGASHIVQLTRVDPHLVALLVDLNARAVELVLERRLTEPRE